MNLFHCPLCQSAFVQADDDAQNILRCENNHSFDRAKEGYVNLLPVQKKKSKTPGDSAEMILARREFLNQGHYQSLASGLLDVFSEECANAKHMLDLGCGEGYYTRYLQSHWKQENAFELYGIDISKPAIRSAAKQNSKGHYAVANAFELPFGDGMFDAVLQVYAYGNPAEVSRVLNDKGLYIIVSPHENHLIELKERIYDNAKTHDLPDIPDGFVLQSERRITDTIMPSKDARNNLLKMTPFYWAAVKEKQERIQQEAPFSITLDFYVQVLEKQS